MCKIMFMCCYVIEIGKCFVFKTCIIFFGKMPFVAFKVSVGSFCCGFSVMLVMLGPFDMLITW